MVVVVVVGRRRRAESSSVEQGALAAVAVIVVVVAACCFLVLIVVIVVKHRQGCRESRRRVVLILHLLLLEARRRSIHGSSGHGSSSNRLLLEQMRNSLPRRVGPQLLRDHSQRRSDALAGARDAKELVPRSRACGQLPGGEDPEPRPRGLAGGGDDRAALPQNGADLRGVDEEPRLDLFFFVFFSLGFFSFSAADPLSFFVRGVPAEDPVVDREQGVDGGAAASQRRRRRALFQTFAAGDDDSCGRGRGRKMHHSLQALRRQRHVDLDPGPGGGPDAPDDVPAAADDGARARHGAQQAEGDDRRRGRRSKGRGGRGGEELLQRSSSRGSG